jgi:hypothetical protein
MLIYPIDSHFYSFFYSGYSSLIAIPSRWCSLFVQAVGFAFFDWRKNKKSILADIRYHLYLPVGSISEKHSKEIKFFIRGCGSEGALLFQKTVCFCDAFHDTYHTIQNFPR